jgi:hypothetical protein
MSSMQTLVTRGPEAVLSDRPRAVQRLTGTKDFYEGYRAFIERRDPTFVGE